ncbi:gonadotropin subunit beta-1-like isoform X2 [Betta splendens]|nr:gonadotropin subunit beta-1-like isoform X2 [Betta splendens]
MEVADSFKEDRFKRKEERSLKFSPESCTVSSIPYLRYISFLGPGLVAHASSHAPSPTGTNVQRAADTFQPTSYLQMRMQLVVMATVLAAAVAGQGCRFGCRPTNISFPVDSCGVTEFIYTTICAGHCYHEDPVYISHDDWAEQSVCSGEWAYEVKQLQGCPLAVTYPVARSCECSACNAANTHCGHFHGYVPSCVM